MALIKCSECGKDFSEYATACPNCGCPVNIVLKSKREDTLYDLRFPNITKEWIEMRRSKYNDNIPMPDFNMEEKLIQKVFGYSREEAKFVLEKPYKVDKDGFCEYTTYIAKNITIDQLEKILPSFAKYHIQLIAGQQEDDDEYWYAEKMHEIPGFNKNIEISDYELDTPVIIESQKVNIYERDNYIPQLKPMAQQSKPTQNLPTCPICGSTNLTKLSNVGKAAKVGFFGIFGAGDLGKTWKCKNCGSKF